MTNDREKEFHGITTFAPIERLSMDLDKLVERAQKGEEIVLTTRGKTIAWLLPYHETAAPRTPEGGKGQVTNADDFDAPLPKEFLRDLER